MAVLATDDFNRADGDIGTTWTATAGFGSGSRPVIVSNEVFNLSGQTRAAFKNTVVCPNDQYSQIVLRRYANIVIVRAALVGGESNLYYFSASTLTTTIKISKYTNNVGGADLVTGTRTNSAGDILYFEAQGTTLIAKINGVQVLTITDASFASGSFGAGHGNTGDDAYDDWVGGDFTAAAGQPTMKRWGGVPHVGGRKGFGRSGGGAAWGRTRDGLWIPQKAA